MALVVRVSGSSAVDGFGLGYVCLFALGVDFWIEVTRVAVSFRVIVGWVLKLLQLFEGV